MSVSGLTFIYLSIDSPTRGVQQHQRLLQAVRLQKRGGQRLCGYLFIHDRVYTYVRMLST